MKNKFPLLAAAVISTCHLAAAAESIVYNPQYCYQARCYPGAYIRGAVDQEGDTVPAAVSAAEKLKQELADVGVERFTAAGYKPGLVRHIVLFRYAHDVTADQKRAAKRRFLALTREARREGKPYIRSIETGAETSGEGTDQGLEQGFIVTFKSEGDRNFYVGQPLVTDARYYDAAHQSYKAFVGPLLDQNGALVFDFTVE